MSHQCGECTICCWLAEVPELNKPAETWCQHCAAGCTIYDQRPQGCRDFDCLWVLNDHIPDDQRPDRSGVMFEPLPPEIAEDLCLAIVDPTKPQAWQQPGPMDIIHNLVGQGADVVVVLNERIHAIFPAAEHTAKTVTDKLDRVLDALRPTKSR